MGVLLFAMGCQTTGGLSRGPEGVESDRAPADKASGQSVLPKTREKVLEEQVEDLNTRLKASLAAREALQARLETAQAAREDAVREVVRIRARMRGMASKAEASAMFAEGRVILDRMEEEAYSAQSLEDLNLARSYLDGGKEALDTGNPGGAAYLFDLIPALYEGMKKSDPRTVKVNVDVAVLRESPEPSARKTGTLHWGDPATGLEKNREWMKVRSRAGQTGWLMRSQVQ